MKVKEEQLQVIMMMMMMMRRRREIYIFKPEYRVHQRIAAKTLHISTSAMKQNELQQRLYILMILVQ